MNHQTITANVVAIFLCVVIFVPTITMLADAAYDFYHPNDVYDLAIDIVEMKESHDIYNYLVDNEWINQNKVSYKQFDYILVLSNQLCTMSRNVRLPLLLAQIAVESRFDIYDEYEGAIGLMQLLPIYHQSRMEKYVENGHIIDLDDFYNPRLNIATGLDYMDEILDDVDGNETYALMIYNQGPASAKRTYINKGITSNYVKDILALADAIEWRLISYYDKEG